MDAIEQTYQWFINHWTLSIAVFWMLEKIVKLTPTKYDDILIDIIWGGIKKAAGKGDD